MTTHDFLIVGAGIFGVTAALELRDRGHDVGILDPGPVPHPLAASTDISKVVRMEYGSDAVYMALADEAIGGWHRWNEHFDEPLYHQTGVTMLTRAPMTPGEFEYESFRLLQGRGHRPQRLDADEISRRYPAWQPGSHVDGFYNARGGFAESGRVVDTLWRRAGRAGIACHHECAARELVRTGERISEVVSTAGAKFSAGHVIVCAGAWTQTLVPELRGVMKASGHPVFHLRPARTENFMPRRLPVFTADISRTGWYGFPLHPREGVIKFGNHGPGRAVDPTRDERIVSQSSHRDLNKFVAATFPALADAPLVYTRLCLYSDTLDEHFWIDRHPRIENLTVAAGGSGHAFKMAPVLGALVANAALEIDDSRRDRFRWRELSAGTTGEEEARCHAAKSWS